MVWIRVEVEVWRVDVDGCGAEDWDSFGGGWND